MRAYGRAAFKLRDINPTEVEMRGMRAALLELAARDKDEAKMLRSKGSGELTVMVFKGDDLLAIGEDMDQGEAQAFANNLWASSGRRGSND